MKEVGKRIRNRVKEARAFLTFDIDFVDPAYAPGTGTIEVGGFTGYETMLLIREMKDLNFVAADFVEVLPGIDPAGVTSYMAANVMHEFISTLALQRKNGKR
jgi:agmatinase